MSAASIRMQLDGDARIVPTAEITPTWLKEMPLNAGLRAGKPQSEVYFSNGTSARSTSRSRAPAPSST